jgi:4-carboxymuconolactone decarboxylase
MTHWPAPRLSPADPATYDARQREIADAIASGPRGAVRGPLAVWLRRPELAAQAQALGRYCRYDTKLPPRLSELAIITVARVWSSEYEWYAHKPIAISAGIPEAAVEAIRTNATPEFTEEDERIVHAFALAAHRDRHVPDAIYAEALAVLGEDALVDLVGILGYYALISLTINIFHVCPPEDWAPELGGIR